MISPYAKARWAEALIWVGWQPESAHGLASQADGRKGRATIDRHNGAHDVGEPLPRLGAVTRGYLALIVLLVFLAGFGELLAFWLIGSWTPMHPGLFDYRAATVGDGLLLPLGAGVLFCGLVWTSRNGRHRSSLLLAGGGLLAGLAVQATWLTDPHPRRNWTLPKPHHFAVPGVTHGVFFVAAAAAFTGFTAEVLLRVHSDLQRRRQLARRGWANALTFVGVAFLGLAAIDDLPSGHTAAGIATASSLALVAAALVAAVWWGFSGTPGLQYRDVVAGAAAGLGLTAISAHGTAGFSPAQAVVVVIVVVALTAALVPAVSGWRDPRTLWAFAAVWLVLAGGTSLAAWLSQRHGTQAALVVIVAAMIGRALGTVRQARLTGQVLSHIAVAFTLALLVLTHWLGGGVRQDDATYALGFASFFLDGLVIGLIRERFGDVIAADTAFAQKDRSSDDRPPNGSSIFVQVIGFGLAALLALGLLYTAAGKVLRINEGAKGVVRVDGLAIGVALVAMFIAITAAAWTYFARPMPIRAPDASKPALRDLRTTPPRRPAVIGVVALVTWGAGFLVQPHLGRHLPLAAGMAAVVFGILVNEDVLRTGARLHAHQPDTWTRTLAAAAGAASALALFWLLTSGVWSGGRPASIGSIGAVLAVVVLGNLLVVRLALEPITRGLQIPLPLSPQGIGWNFTLIGFLYAGLAVVAFVVPFAVLGRVELFHPRNVGLATVSALAPLPALVGAVIWVLDNNARHLEGQVSKAPTGKLAERLGQFSEPSDAAAVRNAWFRCHIGFQDHWTKAALLLGTALVVGSILLEH